MIDKTRALASFLEADWTPVLQDEGRQEFPQTYYETVDATGFDPLNTGREAYE